MKTISKLKILAMLPIVSFIACISCKKENLNDPSAGTSRESAAKINPSADPSVSLSGAMTIKLVDAALNDPYRGVNVEIVGALALYQNSGWKKLDVKAGIYTLEQFRNHAAILSSTVMMPAGEITELRLLLGRSNSVVTRQKGLMAIHALTTPEHFADIKINSRIIAGKDLVVILDFDANNSVSAEGNQQSPYGTFVLYPDVKVRDVFYTGIFIP